MMTGYWPTTNFMVHEKLQFFYQVHHQLLKMGSLVQKIGEIVAKETKYVEDVPLATFLEEDCESLLREANSLIESQVQRSKYSHTLRLVMMVDL